MPPRLLRAEPRTLNVAGDLRAEGQVTLAEHLEHGAKVEARQARVGGTTLRLLSGGARRAAVGAMTAPRISIEWPLDATATAAAAIASASAAIASTSAAAAVAAAAVRRRIKLVTSEHLHA